MNEYEQKKQERIDRLREKASKARAQSDALSRQSWDMISAIPSGQPVMGAADARYRERAGNKMRHRETYLFSALYTEMRLTVRRIIRQHSKEANMEPNNRMGEITGNLKKDVKDLLSESANIVTGFFKRGLCTVRAVADKWKAFAQSVSSAADELMKPPFIKGPEAPTANLHPAAEPVVTVMESRDRNFPVGKQMTLSEANEYVRQMDASRHEAKATPHAVKVKIDYMRGDTSDRYWLPLEIGSGRGGLLEQMEQRLASYRADPERIMGELDFSKVDAKYRDDFQASFLPFIQKSMDDLNSNLLPFFRNHCSITELKRSAEALIPGMGEGRQAQYQAKLDERIAALRQMVNSGELKQAPQRVQIVQSASPRQAAPETPAKPRQSVRVRLERLKEGQAAQTKLPDRARHAPTRPKQK